MTLGEQFYNNVLDHFPPICDADARIKGDFLFPDLPVTVGDLIDFREASIQHARDILRQEPFNLLYTYEGGQLKSLRRV